MIFVFSIIVVMRLTVLVFNYIINVISNVKLKFVVRVGTFSDIFAKV